ncbi:AAA family ATPase [Acidiferrobacter sp. SPIII_3]|uniref:AAA family ATPase n=1 Tax=Acidiferrobacter sp. SPIII_3 TaxID=1281578 RepID=UPI003519DCE5
MGGTTLSEIDQAIDDKAAGLIDVGGGKLTTRDTLYREQEILARVQSGRDQVPAILSTHDTKALIEKTETAQGYHLSEGQREAITLALTTQDRVTGIVGAWGVGKTTGAVRPIIAQAKASGFHTIGMTPTTKAKKELADAKPDELMTIASWLQTKPEMQSNGSIKINENRLIVMDEAAMVGAEDMDRVLQKLDREGGRLVLVGDPQQLRSVGAGAPYQQMMEARAVQFAKISEVQRQSDPRLKQMAQVWADGDAKAAVAIAQEYMQSVTVTDADWRAVGKTPDQERVSESQTQSEAGELKPTDAMIALAERVGLEDAGDLSFQEVREYLDANTEKVLGFDEGRGKDKDPQQKVKPPKIPREVRQAALVRETASSYLSLSPDERADTVLMTSTNKLRSAINTQVRAGLKERGEIGSESVTIRALDKVSMTKEALSRTESYQDRSDLIVRMSEGRGEARRDVDWQVKGVERGRVILENDAGEQKHWNPSTAKSPKVYASREIWLSPGDEINFRDSAGLRDTPDRIENGADAKVVRLSPDGPVARMEDGREVTLQKDQNYPLDYGYCRTVHKAQGMTKGGAIYAVESVGQESISQLAGVACTREKTSLRILTDDPEKVGKAMEKWAVHETAMAATKTTQAPDLDTIQALRREAQAELGHHGDLARARDARPLEIEQARQEMEIER